jgi:glutamate formiminotransferase / formiminotetrahydrofolate cyclodeaminase
VKKILECVPNFSEGRRKEVVDALAAALTSFPGSALLDCEMDAAHNRSVISVAGEPDAVARGVVEAVGKAAELIDLRQHQGEHPRMGATDVVPFIPISGITMEECVELSVKVAGEIAVRYGIPVYLYEKSARIPARQDLAHVRKGEFEGIREEIRTNPDRRPDFGLQEAHPSAGVTAVGARFALIAYNVYLNTSDIKIAQAIARAVRHSGGGLRYVKALGFEIKERSQVQVSINLTNYEGTPIFRAFEMVCREAQRFGATVVSSEIVGLVPQKALDACAEYYLRLEKFDARQILENRLSEVLPAAQEETLDHFVSSVAAADAVPGGGSVAALAGSLAAALGEMVAGLTRGKKKFASLEHRMEAVHAILSGTRSILLGLVREDASAYQGVMQALKLPKDTEEQKLQRSEALHKAARNATEIPLRTARVASDVLTFLEELTSSGNPNTVSDAATGAQLAYAAIKGAQYNVLANLPGLDDRQFANACRSEVSALVQFSEERICRIDSTVTRAADQGSIG